MVAASAMSACFGFLWWNASPAQIFMGDTGSMALGGLMAGLAILTRTELLLVVLGGLFAVVTLSAIMQTGWFKFTRIRTGTGRRVFRMAPLHHHFELAGLGRGHHHRPVLDHRRHRGRLRDGPVLRRLHRQWLTGSPDARRCGTVLVCGAGLAGASAAPGAAGPRRCRAGSPTRPADRPRRR